MSESAQSKTSKLAIASLCLGAIFLFAVPLTFLSYLSFFRDMGILDKYPLLAHFQKIPNLMKLADEVAGNHSIGILVMAALGAGPAGFVCTIVSLVRIRRSKGLLVGNGLSIIAFSVITIAIIMLALIFFYAKIPTFQIAMLTGG